MMKHSAIGIAALGLACGAAVAHEGDYGLLVQGGQVVTGIGNHDTGVISEIGERVFGSELAVNGGFWEAEEPGVFIPEASLPDNTEVSFTIEAALRYWDGVGPVNFDIVPTETMTIEFGPASVSTPASDTDVAGFGINYDADAVGGFDEHFDFLLDGSASAGVYVLQMRFSLSGYADSASTWTVFNAGLDEELHDAAIDYVEASYVPAPSGIAALGIAGVFASRRRRS